jgi:hypothetical protein
MHIDRPSGDVLLVLKSPVSNCTVVRNFASVRHDQAVAVYVKWPIWVRGRPSFEQPDSEVANSWGHIPLGQLAHPTTLARTQGDVVLASGCAIHQLRCPDLL